MTTYAYPPRAWAKHVFTEDAYLLLAVPLLLWLAPQTPFFTILLAAIPVVVGYRIATLHFPSRVVVDDTHVSFSAYGRVHHFAWSDVERVHVRRFLVRDRVLVRVTPSPPWRGKYWLTSAIDGYAALVAELEQRSRR